MIKLIEHKSRSYAPRTYYNAHVAGLTTAVAINYHTGGELCTQKAAGEKYIALPITVSALDNARLLWRELKARNCSVLNIAGNGIYTLQKHGYSQSDVNLYIYEVLRLIQPHVNLEKIVCGGQSGVDIAGAVAAVELGIPVELCYPNGFRVRKEDGIDRDHTQLEIEEWINQQVTQLRVDLCKEG